MDNSWDVLMFFVVVFVPSVLGLVYFLFYRPVNSCQDFMYGKYGIHFIFVGASLAGFCLAPVTLLWPSEIVRTSTTWLVGVTVAFLVAAFASAIVHTPILHYNRCYTIYQYLEDRFRSKFLRYCVFAFNTATALVFATGILTLSAEFAQRSLNGSIFGKHATRWMCILVLVLLTGSNAAVGGQKGAVYLSSFTLLVEFFLALVGAVAVGMHRRQAESFYVSDDPKLTDEFGNDTISNVTSVANWFSSPLAPDYRVFASFGETTVVDQQNVWLTTLACILYFFYVLGCQQTSHQHYCAVPTKGRARFTLLCTALIFLVIWSLTFLLACLALRFYADPSQLLRNCLQSSSFSLIGDPYASLKSFFGAIWTISDGAVGYFLASFTCACAFCCLPTAFVSLATSTYEDLVKPYYCRNAPETRQILVLKTLTIIFASISAVGSLLVSELLLLDYERGQFWWLYVKNACLALATFTTPFAAVYVLAIWLPCTNSKGAVSGLACGAAVALALSLAHLIHLPFDYHVQQPNSLLYVCCDETALLRNLRHAGVLADDGDVSNWNNGPVNGITALNSTITADLENMRRSSTSCLGYDLLRNISTRKTQISALYRVSIPLQSIIAFTVTIVVGLAVSLVTGRQDLYALDWNLVYWKCNAWDNIGLERCFGRAPTNSLDSRSTTGAMKQTISDMSHGNKKRFHQGPYTISESFRYSKQGPLPDTSYLNPKVQDYMATLTKPSS